MNKAPMVSCRSVRLPRQVLADVALLLAAAIWGATFVVVKEAVAHVAVFTFIALRFVLATAALAFLVRPAWTRASVSALRAGALIGLFLFGGYALQTWGLQLTTASKAGFITSLVVVFVPLLSALGSWRLPARSALIGIGPAVIGLGLLTLGDGTEVTINLGDLLVLGCALCFALHILALGHYAPHFDPGLLTTVQVALVGTLSLALAIGTEVVPIELGTEVWGAALFTGILATALAYLIQTHAQRFTSPTHTGLILTGEPVFAALFGYLLAGERLGGRELLGCLLILMGMILAEIPSFQRPHS